MDTSNSLRNDEAEEALEIMNDIRITTTSAHSSPRGMEEKSVLAPVYVPQRFREINWQAAVLLPSEPFPCLQAERVEMLRGCLVPSMVPYMHGMTREIPQERAKYCPLRHLTPEEMHRDTYQAIAQLPSRVTPPPGLQQQAPTKPVTITKSGSSPFQRAPPPPLPPQPPPPPPPPPPPRASLKSSTANTTATNDSSVSVHEPISISIQDYCQAWEKVLWEERSCLLQLYERFSQYNCPIEVLYQPAVSRFQGKIELPGIADATPSLYPGDVVLVRSIMRLNIDHHLHNMSLMLGRGGAGVGAECPLPMVPKITAAFSSHNKNQIATTFPLAFQRHHHIELRCMVQSIVRQSNITNIDLITIPTTRGGGGTAAAATNANNNSIYFSWTTDPSWHHWLVQSIPSFKFNVRFVPSISPLLKCLTALDWLRHQRQDDDDDDLLPLLFPTAAPILPTTRATCTATTATANSDDHNNTGSHTNFLSKMSSSSSTSPLLSSSSLLNVQQNDFVRLVLKRTLHPEMETVRSPLILTGPAGTGKTATMLHAIVELLHLKTTSAASSGTATNPTNNMHGTQPQQQPLAPPQQLHLKNHNNFRILICTPSHTAADVITRRLARHLDRSSLFRLYDPTRPLATVPRDVLPFTRQDLIQQILQQQQQQQISPQLASFSLPPSTQELLSFRVVVCTCIDAHLLYLVGLSNAQLRRRRRRLQHDLSTQCEMANLKVQFGENCIDEPHWTHLFVDEAAQATEPETLIPLSVVVDPIPGNAKVEIALVGDPRQLSPAVYSSIPTGATLRTATTTNDNNNNSNQQHQKNGSTTTDSSLNPSSSSSVSSAVVDLRRSWMERLLLRPIHALGGGQSHMLGPEMVNLQDWIEFSFRGESNNLLSVFLTLNYRCHPAFLMMPSALFYFDKLQSAYNQDKKAATSSWCAALRMVESLSNIVSPHPSSITATSDATNVPHEVHPVKQFDWPIHFRGVVGQDKSVTIKEGYTSESWSNEQEAKVVVEIVQTLIVQEHVSVESVGCMSPFRGQVVRIRELLRACKLGAVNVGTIEDYQSVERHVIVLSLTRSTPTFVANDIAGRVGVFGQPKRSNVALTRAEHLFVVVGNPVVMVKDSIWRQFLLFCYRNGMFYGDSAGIEGELQWKPSNQIVRLRPEKRVVVGGNASSASLTATDQGHENLVIVSSLERNLRRM